MIYIRALIVAGALAMAGCVGTGPANPLLTACNAYASVLFTLSGFRGQGKLTAAQIEAVDSSILIAEPVCNGTQFGTAGDVQAIADRLSLIAAGVQ